MVYSEAECEKFRKMMHVKLRPDYITEWVVGDGLFGEPVFTFDRKTYYNGYADRDRLTRVQLMILVLEGGFGCPDFDLPDPTEEEKAEMDRMMEDPARKARDLRDDCESHEVPDSHEGESDKSEAPDDKDWEDGW